MKKKLPEKYVNNVLATNARERLETLLSDLHYILMDLKEKGVSFSSVEEIRNTTPESIRTQIRADKQQYFRNVKFVPSALRRSIDRGFAEMESDLVPLADSLQKTITQIPVSWALKEYDPLKTGDYCVCYDAEELEKYISSVSDIPIDPKYKEYYALLFDFCEEWSKISSRAEDLQLRLDGSVLRWLFDATLVFTEDGKPFEDFYLKTHPNLNPDKMCRAIFDGVFELKNNNN